MTLKETRDLFRIWATRVSENLRDDILRSVATLDLSDDIDPGVVYFIRPAGRGCVKVGFSRDVNGRLAGLQAANPDELELMAAIAGGVDVESLLHALVSSQRIRGEWFRLEPPLSQLIALAKLDRDIWPLLGVAS